MKIYPLDVRDFVYQTVVSGLAAKITEINTARSAACELPKIFIDDGYDIEQYPEVFIDLDAGDKYFGNENTFPRSADTLQAQIPLAIMVVLKGAEKLLNDWAEIYSEALVKMLEGKDIIIEFDSGYENCGYIKIADNRRDSPINTRDREQTKEITVFLTAHIYSQNRR
jgi:hypothetical protein